MERKLRLRKDSELQSIELDVQNLTACPFSCTECHDLEVWPCTWCFMGEQEEGTVVSVGCVYPLSYLSSWLVALNLTGQQRREEISGIKFRELAS
jgi:hypothetical protein